MKSLRQEFAEELEERARDKGFTVSAIKLCTSMVSTSIYNDIQMIQTGIQMGLIYICECYSTASFMLLRAEFGHIYIYIYD